MGFLDASATSLIISYAVNIVGALVLWFIAVKVASRAQRTVHEQLRKREFDRTLGALFANLARWLVYVLASLACLSIFDVEITAFAAIIGAAGLAVGLALQGSLANVAAGVMLLILRPFSVDEVVKIGDHWGTVIAISLFTTSLDTIDERRIIIPNSNVFNGTIENLTRKTLRRVHVDVGIAYGSDARAGHATLVESARVVEGVIDDAEHPPQVVFKDFGASSLDFEVRVWCRSDEYFAVRDRVMYAIYEGLAEAGIEIPFPQRDVHVRALPPRAGAVLG